MSLPVVVTCSRDRYLNFGIFTLLEDNTARTLKLYLLKIRSGNWMMVSSSSFSKCERPKSENSVTLIGWVPKD